MTRCLIGEHYPGCLCRKWTLGEEQEGVPPGVQARSDGGQMAHVGAAGFSSGSALQVEMAGTGDGSYVRGEGGGGIQDSFRCPA